jgi:hypothetical protein
MCKYKDPCRRDPCDPCRRRTADPKIAMKIGILKAERTQILFPKLPFTYQLFR